MKLGDRDTIASAPMAAAWRLAATELGIRFISPFEIKHEGVTCCVSGLLPDFGCDLGAIIADRFSTDNVFDLCDAIGYYASGLNPAYYETYDRELFVDTLNDWGWFGPPDAAPTWFKGGIREHGGTSA